MTSLSENVKYVNKNCKYFDTSNDLGNSHVKGCHFLYGPPGIHVNKQRHSD